MPTPQQQKQNQQLQKAGQQDQQKQQEALAKLSGMGVDPKSVASSGLAPHKYLHWYKSGKGPAVKQMGLLHGASQYYQGPQNTLSTELTDPTSEASIQAAENDLNAMVDLRKQEDPMIGQMQDYLQARLGVGLTPQEEGAIRSELRAPVESAYQDAVRSAGQAGAAAGIAPGSGVSVARGQQAEQQRQQGESNVENQITQENLARKEEIEREAAGQIGAEEGARAEDIGAQQAQQNLQLQQLGLAEGSLGGLAGLQEGQREFDVTETEAKRQAWLQRQMWEKFAREMQPSGLETGVGIAGGLIGGLTGSA